MTDKLSDKDKKDWQNFLNSTEKLNIKDKDQDKELNLKVTKTIDLHGYSLDDANKKIYEFILSSFENGVSRINIITGKGLRSKNMDNPYQSKDLSILKYSIPNFIKNNKNLMSKIIKIDEDAIQSQSAGGFNILLKKNEKKNFT